MTRIVVLGLPHYVTERGNRRETIFFEPRDYAPYRDWLPSPAPVAREREDEQ